jgi:plasmid maintenance system antidote protein VapI
VEGGKHKMYHFRCKDYAKKYNKTAMAEIIGLAPDTVRRVINGKQDCSKLVAYCITKFLNSNAEIEEYFYKKGE